MVEYTPPEVAAVTGLVDTYLRWKNAQDVRGYERYHPSAFGKAQPLTAMIQTPNGPKEMGSLMVGDKICGVAGDINTVEAIHPQGIKAVYRVTFSDGDYTECCEDHLWEVDSRYMGFKYPKVLSLKRIHQDYLTKGGHRHYRVRLSDPLCLLDSCTSSHSLSPYTIGAIIGDGCLRCECPMITGMDIEIVNRIRQELPMGASLRSRDDNVQHWFTGTLQYPSDSRTGLTHKYNIVKTELEKLKLWGIKTEDRFIPDSFLYSTIAERFALLQGLMDTDGTCSKAGHSSFTTISQRLAEQVSWLVKSLGGLARLYTKPSKPRQKEAYTLHITIKDSSRIFYLPRKAERASKNVLREREINRHIANIELVGNKECQCITVGKPDGLYLTDNCIVTHNCLRVMQYERYCERGYMEWPPKELKPDTLRIFGNGHSMHDRWREYFENIGVLKGYWTCKNPLCKAIDDSGNVNPDCLVSHKSGKWKVKPRSYGRDKLQGCFKPDRCVCGCQAFHYDEIDVRSEELNFYGHCDMILDFSTFDPTRFAGVKQSYLPEYLPSKPIVVDMKTINMFSFPDVQTGKEEHKDYLIQLTIYANILECDYGILIYENKNTQKIHSIKVEKNSDVWFSEIKRQAGLLNEMVDVIDENGKVQHLLPPPRPLNLKSDECTWCPFRQKCVSSGVWEDPELAERRKEFYGELL